jgi:hypothetical protein
MKKSNFTKNENGFSLSTLTRCILMALIFGTVSIMSANAQTTETVSYGTTTWQCPDGVTSISVEMWGAGGGGGGTSANSNKAGGGGAGGSYVKNTIITVTPGTIYNLTIGAGGNGVAGNNNLPVPVGGNGGNTSATFGDLTITAVGGAGGTSGVSATASGVEGAAVSTGNSGYSESFSFYGAAGEAGSGVATVGYGGAGGAAAGSGGAGGARKTAGGAGNAGAIPGGGGGGAFANNTTARTGGAGGNGQIKITYTLAVSTAPTVTNPTATLITTTGATLGGTVSSDGGSAILERGTVWKTTSGVTIDDNKLAEGSTTTGTFSHARTDMSPKTLYYYKVYATNAINTTLSVESSFYTKATQPAITNSITASLVDGDNTKLDISWGAVSGADGYLILRRDGTSLPGTDPTDGIIYSIDNTVGTGTVVAVIYSGSSTSTQISGLTPGATYSFRIAAFGYDGTNAATMNYAQIASTLSATATTALTTNLNKINNEHKAYVSNGQLMFFGGDVYTCLGTKIASAQLTNELTSIKLRSGVYFVKSKMGSQKVVIN